MLVSAAGLIPLVWENARSRSDLRSESEFGLVVASIAEDAATALFIAGMEAAIEQSLADEFEVVAEGGGEGGGGLRFIDR